MLVSFGQAVAVIISEILTGYYKFPVSTAFAGAIAVVVHTPLQIGCLVLAVKYGVIKFESAGNDVN